MGNGGNGGNGVLGISPNEHESTWRAAVAPGLGFWKKASRLEVENASPEMGKGSTASSSKHKARNV